MAIESSPKSMPAPKANSSADSRAAKARGGPDSAEAKQGQGFTDILSSVSDPPGGIPSDAPSDVTVDKDASTAQSKNSSPEELMAAAVCDPANLPAQPQPQLQIAVPTLSGDASDHAVNTLNKPVVSKPAPRLEPELSLSGVAESKTKGLQAALQSARADKSASPTDTQTSTASTANAMPQQEIKLFAAMEAQRDLQAAKEPALVVATASMPGMPERKVEERSIFSKSTPDGTYSGGSNTTTTPEAQSSGATDVALAADAQPAESVKYWISPDVQNAELRLDGLGEKPVEVSISMHGNAAHVAFRSDEAQTRGALETAGGHLKDMMQREGVLLSGVSVGTSGGNDGKGGQPRARQGAKVALVAPALPSQLDAVRRNGGATGRSVDLFV